MGIGVWEWDDDERDLLSFIYRFWVEQRRPPNMADIVGGTGVAPRRARRLCRQVQEGFGLTFFDERVHLTIDKAPPFSATPTAVACFADDEFLSYLGCAMEATTVGWLPMLEDRVLTIRSACACCFEPIELQVRRDVVLSCTPAEPVVTAIRSPWDFEHGVTPDRVCDSFHYALDAEHARRFDEQVGRRGVLLRLDQVQAIARSAGEERMRHPHWKAIRLDAAGMIESWAAAGVDVSPWR